MDSFIMMEKFEIQLREPQNERKKKNKEKYSLKSENLFYFTGDYSGLLHAAPSAL